MKMTPIVLLNPPRRPTTTTPGGKSLPGQFAVPFGKGMFMRKNFPVTPSSN